jgi:hypothetical protein
MSFGPNTPLWKRYLYTAYILPMFFIHNAWYIIKTFFRDKWLTFKYRKESAEVKKKYLINPTFAPWYKRKNK